MSTETASESLSGTITTRGGESRYGDSPNVTPLGNDYRRM